MTVSLRCCAIARHLAFVENVVEYSSEWKAVQMVDCWMRMLGQRRH